MPDAQEQNRTYVSNFATFHHPGACHHKEVMKAALVSMLGQWLCMLITS
jgi:hypothetical protein